MEYARHRIWMNAVDTGWVTDEFPHMHRFNADGRFHPPVDEEDGAARCLDPVFVALNSTARAAAAASATAAASADMLPELPHGIFYKDYRPAPW